MNDLGRYIKETIDQIEFDNHVKALCDMPDWEFCVVMGEGFFDCVCAGTKHKDTYYTERELYTAYFTKWSDAEPLI